MDVIAHQTDNLCVDSIQCRLNFMKPHAFSFAASRNPHFCQISVKIKTATDRLTAHRNKTPPEKNDE